MFHGPLHKDEQVLDDQLCTDTRYGLEDLPEAMENKDMTRDSGKSMLETHDGVCAYATILFNQICINEKTLLKYTFQIIWSCSSSITILWNIDVILWRDELHSVKIRSID